MPGAYLLNRYFCSFILFYFIFGEAYHLKENGRAYIWKGISV